jgi:hypothetical protein
MNVKLIGSLGALSLAALIVPGTASATDVLADCRAAWEAAKDTSGNVNPLLVDSKKCVTVNEPDKTWGDYTLLSTISFTGTPADAKTHLIDMEGRRVKTWPLTAFPAKMLPNGDVIAGIDYQDPSFSGKPHQEGACLLQMDWHDRIVWPRNTGVRDECALAGSLPIPFDTEDSDPQGRPTARVHHDFQREGNPVGYFAPGQEAKQNGKMLILGHANPPLSKTGEVSDTWPLEDDPVYEVSSNGKTILWRWDPYEHIDQMGFDTAAREAIRLKKVTIPGAILGTPEHDWLHLNDANYLGINQWCRDPKRAGCDLRFHPDNIIIDSREANFMAIIARHDYPTIKNMLGSPAKEGDIVWRVGPTYNYGAGKVDQLIGMHHAHMIPAGLPGAGNILVFDNGGGAGYGLKNPLPAGCTTTGPWPNEVAEPPFVTAQCLTRSNKFSNFSRVIEFNPKTLAVVWEYKNTVRFPASGTCRKPEDASGNVIGDFRFFSLFISSAQRLPNGNTLIDEGASGRVFEVTQNLTDPARDKKVVWEFVNPFGNEVVGGVSGPGCTANVVPGTTGNIIYRAYRVPTEWIPKQSR